MSNQTWTKELRAAVNKLERNKNGLVKVVSAMEWLNDQGIKSKELNDAGFALVQERRNLRLQFCEELERQDKWNRR